MCLHDLLDDTFPLHMQLNSSCVLPKQPACTKLDETQYSLLHVRGRCSKGVLWLYSVATGGP